MANAGPSLILSQHENAHREHRLSHQNSHRHHHHINNRRRRQATTSVVTEVTRTISVVQQIDVDSNGSTFAIETITADATDSSLPTLTQDPGAAATSTIAASPIVASDAAATSTEPGASATDSLPSIPTSSGSFPSPTSSSFPSLAVTSNSSTLSIQTASNFSINALRNSTFSSNSSQSTSLTYLSSTTSVSSSSPSLTSEIPTTSTPWSTSSTAVVGADSGAAATGVISSSAPARTSDSGSASNSSGGTTPTPVVIGSVVGSIAGFAVILLVLLVILRWWKKKNGSHLSLSCTNSATQTRAIDFSNPAGGPSRGMQDRRSLGFAIPAALANLAGLHNRDRTSRQTDRTISSTAGSERGFYRVSGRKLPSVFQHGGDGYAEPGDTTSGQSFYRDSQIFYGKTEATARRHPSILNLDTVNIEVINPNRESARGIPVMRPSPARTPVTAQGPFIFPSPSETPPSPSNMVSPDAVGRSHASLDGSRASRFTEVV